MAALAGVAVLVTRPEQQAMPLCGLLQAAGAMVMRLPALQIRAVVDGSGPESDSAAGLGTAEAFDIIIFTSANAVHHGAYLAVRHPTAALAAIGSATARALQERGLAATVTPSGGSDSEHLLLHPRLAHPGGQRILIVKGRKGRELLREQLTGRGARVAVAEVYERLRADYGDAQLSTLTAQFAAGGIDIITATSADVATALIELATPALRREFERVHWLVPGPRVAEALRRHGITAPLILAASAEDHDLLAAILRWRSSVSGA
jgi:uroporphyrinogen-III synthase